MVQHYAKEERSNNRQLQHICDSLLTTLEPGSLVLIMRNIVHSQPRISVVVCKTESLHITETYL